MTRLTLAGALGSGVLLVVLAACGGGSTPSPQASAALAAPSEAAPSAAAPSVAPPSIAPSEVPSVEPSDEAPSQEPIPSFLLPSKAKDLEALLPDKLCGKTSIKASETGDAFSKNAGNADFVQVLQAMGKTPNDVAFAIAVASGNCVAGIFRIKGVDPGLLQSTFLAEEQKQGKTFTQKTVGGKSVYVESSDTKTYAYFSGDAVLFASADTETQAATILQQMP